MVGFCVGLYLGIGIGIMWSVRRLYSVEFKNLSFVKITFCAAVIIWPVIFVGRFSKKEIARRAILRRYLAEMNSNTASGS